MAKPTLACIGRKFHRYLKSILPTWEEGDIFTAEEIAETLDYGEILGKFLNKLQFNEEVYLHMARFCGSGDNSWFYVGSLEERKSPVEVANVSCDEMTAWQLYLMDSAVHVLPFFWHGGYSQRKYIFSAKEILGLKSYLGPSAATMAKDTELYPSVITTDFNAFVRCCYWTDWGGLIRETKLIEFAGGKVLRIETINEENIYEYDCGILY